MRFCNLRKTVSIQNLTVSAVSDRARLYLTMPYSSFEECIFSQGGNEILSGVWEVYHARIVSTFEMLGRHVGSYD